MDGSKVNVEHELSSAGKAASSAADVSNGAGVTTAATEPGSNGDTNGHKSTFAHTFSAPVPGSIPVPLAEHEALHTAVQRARNISIFSIVFTLACASVGLAFFYQTRSSALLGYSLEALVDVWSSILVLWRFWNDPEGEGHYFLITQRRENRASVGIAFTFVLIGYVTCWQAVVHLIEQEPPTNSEVLLAISGTSVFILSWSCATKLSLSSVLQSSSLRQDAITSGAVAAMALTMLISTAIFKSHPSVWWLDAVVALCISVTLSLLGIATLIKHPWWRRDFWHDGHLSAEEKPAAHIMELPFGSPRQRDMEAADEVVRELTARQQAAATSAPVNGSSVLGV